MCSACKSTPKRLSDANQDDNVPMFKKKKFMIEYIYLYCKVQ